MIVPINVGDELFVRVNDGTTDDPWHQTIKVQIIGIGNGDVADDVLCYVPSYQNAKRSFKLNGWHQRVYEFDDKFLSERAVFVKAVDVVRHEPAIDGNTCKRCQEFIMWAEKSDDFVCNLCKANPFR